MVCLHEHNEGFYMEYPCRDSKKIFPAGFGWVEAGGAVECGSLCKPKGKP
jgi:hypothetical protein